ncbi:hypothetical protein [Terrihabitans rhizophilus]|uniref:Transposase n=1 Tax=Terrihabitans rhizophilus TaxID=3092662 RepID=A0ABU4RS33_9HYPH|nr:hypothetical protein [Terrihabitans sp. PJ23]MDX6807416.1 hypothetical protein [Terrihabitans sp. PJ23]
MFGTENRRGRVTSPLPADDTEHWMVSPRVNGSALDDAEMLNSL